MNQLSLRSEEGQSVVLIALMMIGLVAMVGLAIDGGEVYLARRDAQNASDASAYAGARVMATNRSDNAIRDAIDRYALENNVASAADIVAYYINSSGDEILSAGGVLQVGRWPGRLVPPVATGVVVTSTIRFQPFLIGIVTGGEAVSVPAAAKAMIGQPSGMDHLMPVTLQIPTSGSFDYYPRQYTLLGDTTAPGNFQWLDYDIGSCGSSGSGPTNVVYGMLRIPQDCTSPLVSIKSWVGSKTGISPNSGIREALDVWLTIPENKRFWIIPIYDNLTGSGTNVQYHVIQFAQFTPTGYYFGEGQNNALSNCPQGGTKCIRGYFNKFVIPRYLDTPGQCNDDGIDICAMSLWE